MTTPDTTRLAEIRARFVRTDTPEGVFCSWGRDDVATLLSLVEQLQKQVESYRKDVALLMALEANGVDNWVGYEDAVEAARALGLGEEADDER